MPGRRFPGLVIQGDSLNILYRDLRELEETLRTAHGTDSDMTESAKHMADALHERLWWYESALKDAGYQELPYVYSVGKPVESGDG